ncbi:hypothetical protein RYG28_004188 [Providencia rettgeri]|nr:hypothetical protein [Providencia rettgeri]
MTITKQSSTLEQIMHEAKKIASTLDKSQLSDMEKLQALEAVKSILSFGQQ